MVDEVAEAYEFFIGLCLRDREWEAVEFWFNRLGTYLEEQGKSNARA